MYMQIKPVFYIDLLIISPSFNMYFIETWQILTSFNLTIKVI